jgi:hypothetical protein
MYTEIKENWFIQAYILIRLLASYILLWRFAFIVRAIGEETRHGRRITYSKNKCGLE